MSLEKSIQIFHSFYKCPINVTKFCKILIDTLDERPYNSQYDIIYNDKELEIIYKTYPHLLRPLYKKIVEITNEQNWTNEIHEFCIFSTDFEFKIVLNDYAN